MANTFDTTIFTKLFDADYLLDTAEKSFTDISKLIQHDTMREVTEAYAAAGFAASRSVVKTNKEVAEKLQAAFTAK